MLPSVKNEMAKRQIMHDSFRSMGKVLFAKDSVNEIGSISADVHQWKHEVIRLYNITVRHVAYHSQKIASNYDPPNILTTVSTPPHSTLQPCLLILKLKTDDFVSTGFRLESDDVLAPN